MEPNTAEKALIQEIETQQSNLIVLGLGFASNLAQAFEAMKKSHINRMILMGGT
jgi:hypothetical protein